MEGIIPILAVLLLAASIGVFSFQLKAQQRLKIEVRKKTAEIEELRQRYVQESTASRRLDKTAFHLFILYQASKFLNSFYKAGDLLKYAVDMFAEVIGSNEALILILDTERAEFLVGASKGLPQIENLKLETDSPFFGEAPAIEAVPVDRLKRAFFGESAPEMQNHLMALGIQITVPLVHRNEFLGFVGIGKKISQENFSHDDLELLVGLANMTASALENTRFMQMAVIDNLTKVFVTRFFHQCLKEEIVRATRYKRTVSLLIVDIDHFKRFNDTYGHLTGDKVLREVAQGIKNTVRQEVDTVARYAGDEFVVILPETPLEGATVVAERVRESVDRLDFEQHFKVTLSVGVANYPNNAASHTELLDQADKALYRAKEAGRNRVCTAEELVPSSDGSLESSAYELAITDYLTRFYIAPYFRQRIDDEIKRAKRYQRPCSLLFLSIDKYVNYQEILVRKEFERLIRTLADYLWPLFRRGVDVAGRYTKDKIGFILPETHTVGALQLAARILDALEQQAFPGFECLGRITVSCGLATFPDDAGDAISYLDRALMALRVAEERGGNVVMAYSALAEEERV
ncbi:MAG: diguanylate cyclase [Armatimonadetes bacterium]|nr:diguanylate cyclase [Armatimonadota bacterium]